MLFTFGVMLQCHNVRRYQHFPNAKYKFIFKQINDSLILTETIENELSIDTKIIPLAHRDFASRSGSLN